MRFYIASSFIFPRSFHLRLFSLCFVATHMPLIAFIAWNLAQGRLPLEPTVVLTLATLIGTALAIFGAAALLAPIGVAAKALGDLEDGKPVSALPSEGQDLVAQLLASVNRAASATTRRVSHLDAAAHRDVLTGLYNRRGLAAHIEARPVDERKGVLALLDIDYFKKVNDVLGHGEGDRVLRHFAARLSAEIRRDDVAARWGGEEFAVLFLGAAEAQAAAVLGRVARAMVHAPIASLENGPVTFSGGIARFEAGDLEDALSRADTALYRAKRQGRNRILFADRADAA